MVGAMRKSKASRSPAICTIWKANRRSQCHQFAEAIQRQGLKRDEPSSPRVTNPRRINHPYAEIPLMARYHHERSTVKATDGLKGDEIPAARRLSRSPIRSMQ